MYIIKDKVFVTPTIKVDKYRLSLVNFGEIVEEVESSKRELVEWFKWFNTMEEVKTYLNEL